MSSAYYSNQGPPTWPATFELSYRLREEEAAPSATSTSTTNISTTTDPSAANQSANPQGPANMPSLGASQTSGAALGGASKSLFKPSRPRPEKQHPRRRRRPRHIPRQMKVKYGKAKAEEGPLGRDKFLPYEEMWKAENAAEENARQYPTEIVWDYEIDV